VRLAWRGAFKRARAELRVVAFLGQQLLRRAVHVQRELLLLRQPVSFWVVAIAL